MEFAKYFGLTFVFYLALTIGSGGDTYDLASSTAILGFWSIQEFIIGIVAAALVAFAITKSRAGKGHRALMSKWRFFFVFLPHLFVYMVKANLDVAWRVITGKTYPGIVKVPSGVKTDFGVAMLSNSITLTPGTLTVDVDEDNNLYVHWISVKTPTPTGEDIYGKMGKIIRRLEE